MKKYEHMEIAFRAELKTRAKFILQCLAMHANREGKCFPGIKTIAAECGYSVNTVKRALKDLEEAGFIKKEARFDVARKNGAQTSNLYTLQAVEVPEKKRCEVPEVVVIMKKNDEKEVEAKRKENSVDNVMEADAVEAYEKEKKADIKEDVGEKIEDGEKTEIDNNVYNCVDNYHKIVDKILLVGAYFFCYFSWAYPSIRNEPP